MIIFFSFLILLYLNQLVSASSSSIPASQTITSLCTGGGYACALSLDKRLKCWGRMSSYGFDFFSSNAAAGDKFSEIGEGMPIINIGSSISASKVFCGFAHVCVTTDGNEMKCFGQNANGETALGVSANVVGEVSGHVGNALPYVNLGNGLKVLDVALGNSHSCFKVTGNKVKCVGNNQNGQLGYGFVSAFGKISSQLGDNLPFVDFGANVEVLSIHSGPTSNHNCVILSAPAPAAAQRIKCWGWSPSYQLGYGDLRTRGDEVDEMGDRLPLVNLGTDSRVVQIGVGEMHTCALLAINTLKCWGFGSEGQLGSGSQSSISMTGNSVPSVSIDSGKSVKTLIVGGRNTCILYDDNESLKCIGSNFYGQLALGDSMSRGNTMETIIPMIPNMNFGTGTLDIAMGRIGQGFICVVFVDSSVKCVGDNRFGQLAQGNSKDKVGDETNELGNSLPFSLIFESSRSPTQSPSRAPTLSPTNSYKQPIISFCNGGTHGCAVFNNYQFKCFGSERAWGLTTNFLQGLGGAPDEVGAFLPYIDVGTNSRVEKVYCGNDQTCVILNTGAAKCMGKNTYGESALGLSVNLVGSITGYTGNSLPAINIGTGLGVVDIALGFAHSCFIVTGNKVKCYGLNDSGQLGQGNKVNKGSSPNDIGNNLPFINLGAFVEVASIQSNPGGSHTCIITLAPIGSDKRVKCWGLNDNYQLGYGNLINRGDDPNEMGDQLFYVDFGTESRVKQITLGAAYTCALLLSDNIKCYGRGFEGQLGSGSTGFIGLTGNSMPIVDVDSGKKVSLLDAGREHTCIVYNDLTTMKCIGNNANGQLGQGDILRRGNSPTTKIPSIPAIQLGTGALKISSIFAAEYFTCVMFADSTVKCFGDNSLGQLAIGSTTSIGDNPGEMGINLQYAKISSPAPPTASPSKTPTRRPTYRPVGASSLAVFSFCAGSDFSCFLFDNKRMKCVGNKFSLGLSATSEEVLGKDPTELGNNLPYFNIGTEDKIENISCGFRHLCVKLESGKMKCLGWNAMSQTGTCLPDISVGEWNNYVGDDLPTVDIDNTLQILDIAVGYAHSCAKVTGNLVKCFGFNIYGQIGHSDRQTIGTSQSQMGVKLPFTDLGLNVEVASIHSGPAAIHNCAVLSAPANITQRIKCWGGNHNYQLGYGNLNNRGDQSGEMGDNLPLVDLGTESRVRQVTLGQYHTCVLLVTSDVKCFGFGGFGQLNSGSTADISAIGNRLPSLIIDSGRSVRFISAGGYHTCIGYDDQLTIKCVGDNTFGQLGQGDITNRGNTIQTRFSNVAPIALSTTPLRIASIQSGVNHNCVIFVDSTTKCFGDNSSGQSGTGTALNAIGDLPEEMGGNLQYAYLFSSSTSPTRVPTKAPTIVATQPIISSCTGYSHTCVVFSNNRMKCAGSQSSWGYAFSGNLGDSLDEIGANLPFIYLGLYSRVEQVFCGSRHTCIILLSGDIICLGNNQHGQIGIGSTINLVGEATGYFGDGLPMVEIGFFVQATEMALGSKHSCVKTNENKIKCYGNNDYGQLGQGNTDNIGKSPYSMGDSLNYVDLGTETAVSSIISGSGSDFSCVILSKPATAAQRIKCWGKGSSYQLGYSDSNNRGDAVNEMGNNLPLVDLGNESRVAQLAIGAEHICALLVDNNIKCWGRGQEGQLVSGSIDSIIVSGTNIPSVIPDNDTWPNKIAAGWYHTCIVFQTSMYIKCFGDNSQGQLGQGDKLSRGNSPTTKFYQVPAIQLGTSSRAINAIRLGGRYSCVIFADSSVRCFGGNESGQLVVGSNRNVGDSLNQMGANLKYSTLIASSQAPTSVPSATPTRNPTKNPTHPPTRTFTSRPTRNPTLSPTIPPAITGPIISFCAGEVHACAVFDNKLIKCWGSQYSWGQSLSNIGDSSNELGDALPYLSLGTGIGVDQVSCGSSHICVKLSNTGDVKCLGNNINGQAGIGSTLNPVGLLTLPLISNVSYVDFGRGLVASELVLGFEHSCIKTVGNGLKCFGDNQYGQLGYEDIKSRGSSAAHMGNNLPFVELGKDIAILSIHSSSSAFHNCAILTGDLLKCWGFNVFNQLGYYIDGNLNIGDDAGEMGDDLPFVDFGTESRVKMVTLGGFHTCVLLVNDNLRCIGNGLNGQLGLGGMSFIPISNSLTNVLINANKKIHLLSAGQYHTCIVYDDLKSLKCIGLNNFGQLGQGDKMDRGNSPETIYPLIPAIDLGANNLDISSIRTGSRFNCIIFVDSSVKCFGLNNKGQLLIGSNQNVGDNGYEMGNGLRFAKLLSSPIISQSISPSSSNMSPTATTTNTPSHSPSQRPATTQSPSQLPTLLPTSLPSPSPSQRPSTTTSPSVGPTLSPTQDPIIIFTKSPTATPSSSQTRKPTTRSPTIKPTRKPTLAPSKRPSKTPTRRSM